MKVKIKFKKSEIEIEGELLNRKTAKVLYDALPSEASWCIFFGPTPISKRGEIRSDSPVNVLGKVESSLEKLNRVKEGDIVIVEPLE